MEPKNRKGTKNKKRKPKWAKARPKTLPVEQERSKERKSTQKGSVPWHEMGTMFDKKQQNYHPNNHQKRIANKYWSLCQNGRKNDAKSHQKEMPKQVAKRIMNMIKNVPDV